MQSFKSYLTESELPSGNYVAAYCGTPNVPQSLMPNSGKVPTNDTHITIIYSPESNVSQSLAARICNMMGNDLPLHLKSAECFDAVPKEGERDENLATLVLKVVNPIISELHTSMKMLGMMHTYPEFSPHISLAYNVDREEAYQCAERINHWLLDNPGQFVSTTHYVSKTIDKDWVSKL